MMRNKNFLLFLPVIGLALVPAFFNFQTTSAQTQVAVTPTPSPVKPATPTPTPAEDDETIRIETELVNLNVRVIDRNNRPVNNLRKEDFRVFEDNVPQEIDAFTKAEVPTNYALVIDNSGSLRMQLDKVVEASKIIVGTNKAEDETSVIRFVDSEKIEITQDFTSSKADLTDALDNLFIEGGQTAIIDAVYLAAQRVEEYERSKNPNEKKRRALILVSDGEDRDSFYNEQQLFDLLRESEVQIYAIGFVSELSKEGGFISKSPQAKAKLFMERLAKETGGKVYFPNSVGELNGIAADIASELRTQYLLSYSPTNTEKDGNFRAIKVTVTDGPNKERRIAQTRTGRKAIVEPAATPSPKKP
jgi:Ca-activated chloride channel family protein